MTSRALGWALALMLAGFAWLGGAWLFWRGATAPQASDVATAVRYHCPMHPTMVSERPGSCPICQMQLVPIETGEPGAAGRTLPADAARPAPQVPGLSVVHVAPARRQLIGVRTEPVRLSAFQRSIRAVGRVVRDETRERTISIKTSGYVEQLHANAIGESVHKGQPLLDIYSPELLASQQEYLLALGVRSRVLGSSLPSIAGSGDELVASVRRRLQLLDVSEQRIAELEAGGPPNRTVTLYSPISGTLTHRAVTQGDRIEAGAQLLQIVDLSRVWVVASIYEHELPFVREGQPAVMNLSYLPGRTFAGRVSLIYPQLDPATRTAQVRLEFANPEQLLKPEMYAEVELSADLGQRLAVPDSAVIETGTRSVVFVDRGDGRLEPREIRIGLRLPERYEVLGGLVEGETVVTSGNFLIDSESRLAAALQSMAEPPASSDHRH